MYKIAPLDNRFPLKAKHFRLYLVDGNGKPGCTTKSLFSAIGANTKLQVYKLAQGL